MTERSRVFCASCAKHHMARVSLGEGDYPQVEWLQPHDPPMTTRAEAIERLGNAAGSGLATALDVGNWALVEKFASALEVNDPKPGDDPKAAK